VDAGHEMEESSIRLGGKKLKPVDVLVDLGGMIMHCSLHCEMPTPWMHLREH